MTNASPMKVYELAKDLGMDSFGLLDVLKKIGIEVKSHMSSLEPDQVEATRGFLLKKDTGSSSNGTAKTIKKTKSTASSAAGTTTVKKTAVRKPSTQTTKKAASEDRIDANSPVEAKTKVIKRRQSKDEDDSTSLAQSTVSKEQQDFAYDRETEVLIANEFLESTTVTLDAPVEHNNVSITASSAETNTATIVTKSENITPTQQSTKISKDSFFDDEMIDKSVTQRRLKIIQSAPPASAQEKTQENKKTSTYKSTPFADTKETATSPQKGMFRPITSVLGDQEEEGRKKRGAEQERSVEDIKVSDFRKREVIFQPKKRKLPPGKIVKKTEITTPGLNKRKIRIENTITLSELAQRLSEKPTALVKKLMELGVEYGDNLNHILDFDIASLVAQEYKYEVENIAFDEKKLLTDSQETSEEKKEPRPPIVTIMGHVDHGKTTLLDTIRNASVASGEAGGITQHIGAYSVVVDGHTLTFLDTPGHEAFNSMRKRGANLTDIVVLVVAADDGIMPQTKEAIAIAQAANVPMIVAANKVDKHDANIEKLKQTLSENNVLVEEWGGEIPLVPVSALKKTGIKELLETIYLQSEVMELKANQYRQAEGIVLEARMQQGRGIVADVLVQEGTLKAGDFIVCGTAYGRVRAMMNELGKTVKEVKPGYPVEFAGLNDVPEAGEKFYCVKTESDAKTIAQHRKDEIRKEKEKASERKQMTIEDVFAADPNAGKKQLNIMVKADVFGSLEAIYEAISQFPDDKVVVKVVNRSVGAITDNDVLMAQTANAQIFGFNVKPDGKAKETAKKENITIHTHSIIYELLDTVKASMESLLEPIRIERSIGKADVKQAFTVSKIGLIAGCMVADGKITRNSFAKVFRSGEKVYEGTVISLKRFKDDAREVIKGQECGIGVEKYIDIQSGDRIEAFQVEFEKARL